MYLADQDLKALLPELQFKTAHPKHVFEPDSQIQPCSIDLRLDNVFWLQRWGQQIDLRRTSLLEQQPRRHWEKRRLSDGQSITLRPREMILGRTYESFRIPAGFAGKLEGRSSFSRMGLAIHCSADFINPGYGGHMPLQLINLGTHTIKVYPYLSVCQLIVIKLSSKSARLYGDDDLHSKYVDDDGGPSFWWRDKRIRALQTALGMRSAGRHSIGVARLYRPT
jgi:deoxycytidine triphosphate deaminase